MNVPPSARPPGVPAGHDVLDETDPHAGDDADWADDDKRVAIAEPSPLLFWKGLVVGLFLSVAAWALLAAIMVTVYAIVAD
jgi:hypothetical protein